MGRSFVMVFYHVHLMRDMHREARGGNDKRLQYSDRFSGINYSSQLRGTDSQGRYPLHLPYKHQC